MEHGMVSVVLVCLLLLHAYCAHALCDNSGLQLKSATGNCEMPQLAGPSLPPDSRLHWRMSDRGTWYCLRHWAQPCIRHLLHLDFAANAISTVYSSLAGVPALAELAGGPTLAELVGGAALAELAPLAEIAPLAESGRWASTIALAELAGGPVPAALVSGAALAELVPDEGPDASKLARTAANALFILSELTLAFLAACTGASGSTGGGTEDGVATVRSTTLPQGTGMVLATSLPFAKDSRTAARAAATGSGLSAATVWMNRLTRARMSETLTTGTTNGSNLHWRTVSSAN